MYNNTYYYSFQAFYLREKAYHHHVYNTIDPQASFPCLTYIIQEETWQAVIWRHPTVPPQYDILALDRVSTDLYNIYIALPLCCSDVHSYTELW